MKSKKVIKKYDISKFKPLKEKGQKLTGGFSIAIETNVSAVEPTYPWGTNKNCVGCGTPG